MYISTNDIPEWSDVVTEEIFLRAKTPNSFTITESWCIGRRDEQSQWRVFYRGVCAWYRLHGTDERDEGAHATFKNAYEWIRNLSQEQTSTITGK